MSTKYIARPTNTTLCIDVHNPAFDDPQVAANDVTSAFAAAGVPITGWLKIRGDDDYFTPLPSAGLAPLIAVDDCKFVQLCHRQGTARLLRTPRKFHREYWSENLCVRIYLHEEFALARGIELLQAFVEHLECFWGEVLDYRVVGSRTLKGPNEHACCVPEIGNVNYFGPEYLRYFGGVERFLSAPSVTVEACGPGILTRLPSPLTNEDYLAHRLAIKQHLGERLFEPVRGTDRRLYLSLFGPQDPAQDPIYEITIEERNH